MFSLSIDHKVRQFYQHEKKVGAYEKKKTISKVTKIQKYEKREIQWQKCLQQIPRYQFSEFS